MHLVLLSLDEVSGIGMLQPENVVNPNKTTKSPAESLGRTVPKQPRRPPVRAVSSAPPLGRTSRWWRAAEWPESDLRIAGYFANFPLSLGTGGDDTGADVGVEGGDGAAGVVTLG